MNGFVDETVIHVSSGSGGNGAVSFRREKYVPKGGPDGGDGGKGGDVVFDVLPNLKTLAHLKLRRHFAAENGKHGSGKKKHGRDGRDVRIAVPPGTIISNRETGELIADLGSSGEEFVLLRGGKGGRGNSHFATPTRQTPRFAEEGRPGESSELKVELHLIADVGIVGQPNAGKSTLLSVLTSARPLIGDYPFTTKTPNLGLLRLSGVELVLADIPGIVEGASGGRGLGLRFLKHVERCSVLLYLVDVSGGDAAETVRVLERELAGYSPALAGKPRLLVAAKLDLEGAEEGFHELASRFPAERVFGVSAFSRRGLDVLAGALLELAGRPA